MATSSSSSDRIGALDVLRGIAILGTFASNAWLFALPGGPATLLQEGFAPGGGVETVLRALSNGKFLALLTLLFGIGLELQYRSAVRRGMPWPGRYPVRAAVLFVEGLVHYVLVFEFDVLMGYAITSLVVAYLIGRSDRAVRTWMWSVGATFALLVLAVTALLVATPDGPVASATASTASWPAQVATRLALFPLFRIELVLIVPSATVLFLAGSRLLRAGALDDTVAGARLRRRLVAAGLGLGVPLTALTTVAGPDWFLVDRYLVPPLVAVGLLALVTEVVIRTRGGIVRRGLAAVGRTALYCYVGQNVLASVLCFGWGLGLATRFDAARPWWVVGLWAAVSLACVLAASAWLRRFDRGPLEMITHRIHSGRQYREFSRSAAGEPLLPSVQRRPDRPARTEEPPP